MNFEDKWNRYWKRWTFVLIFLLFFGGFIDMVCDHKYKYVLSYSRYEEMHEEYNKVMEEIKLLRQENIFLGKMLSEHINHTEAYW